jgi:DNA polymerase-3 subunit gamma/tau
MMAAEMAIIRLTHVAELPSPEELVRKLDGQTPPPRPPAGPGGGGATVAPRNTTAEAPRPTHSGPTGGTTMSAQHGQATALATAPETALARYARFEDVIELIRHNRDVKLLVEVETTLRLGRYSPGRIEFTPTDTAPTDLASRLGQRLQTWTGARWGVSVVGDATAPTIAETRDAERLEQERDAMKNPLVQAVFDAFPQTRISAIRTAEDLAQIAADEALPEVPDEWDPFEED